jgi:hypothetical protein
MPGKRSSGLPWIPPRTASGVRQWALQSDPSPPEEAFQAIGRLRNGARDEINRLILFLDKTDDYVSRELEQEDGNDEPEGDDEPSLGSFDRMAKGDLGPRCGMSVPPPTADIAWPHARVRSVPKGDIAPIQGCGGVHERINRYGAESKSRKSALSALYFASGRLGSEPSMTILPFGVQTCHSHFWPRAFKDTSKTEN